MSVFSLGKEIGYTPEQIRSIINKEFLYKDIMECNNLEDIKILLMSWVEQGKIK